jgi:glycosyltransferase involved in cell wall biosynthesis
MSSKNEGMPVVIVEAALKGVPTLSTNVGGVNEFIQNGQFGILSESDAKEMGGKLAQLIANPAKLKILSEASLQLSTDEYSLKKMIQEHLALYLHGMESNR